MSEVSSNQMMALGDYVFSVDTAEFQELARKHSWRWVTHERLLANGASHYQGPNTGEITINGTIYVETNEQLHQLSNMKAEGDKGLPLELSISSGRGGSSLGQWCMLELNETQTHFLPDGTPTKFTFTMRLQEYGSD